MEPVSVLDIFKIGVGPSSSHTMGPWKACRRCVEEEREAGRLSNVQRVEVHLYGSLAKTGRGHGTGRAVIFGLMGEDPEWAEPDLLEERVRVVREERRLCLLGEHEVPFDPAEQIVYRSDEVLPFHSNALRVRLQDGAGAWCEATYYSVGGGFVVKEGEEPGRDTVDLPYPCATGEELRAHCHETGLPVSELVRRNEHAWHGDAYLEQRLHRIWAVMKTCLYRGCHTEGTLPGGLDVRRRAGGLHRKLMAARHDLGALDYDDEDAWLEVIRSTSYEFGNVLKWVSCFAIAVNEQNAAFGRVVTAPTNGAAGVVPAVLAYYLCFGGGTEEDVVRFLLTAGQIGSLFRQRATISAAMGGCQAEIGVSSAMASAALTECQGGDVEQVLMAAEIAMEHHLGMTCDPVGGLVQIPCIERNSMGAVKAITAANIALESDPAHARVSLDAVIRSMWETAQDMNEKYKETSEGGLAVHIPVNVIEC